MKEQLEKLLAEIESKIDNDFDFDVEHWENGNYDDSYAYGVEVGEEFAYREMYVKLKAILSEIS
jgi:hypothetical protein